MNTPTFTVYRATWERNVFKSTFCRVTGMKSCLGHIAKQSGIPLNGMLHSTLPSCIARWSVGRGDYHKRFPETLQPLSLYLDQKLAMDLNLVNDNFHITDAQREVELQKLAESGGFRLIFTDEPEPRPFKP